MTRRYESYVDQTEDTKNHVAKLGHRLTSPKIEILCIEVKVLLQESLRFFQDRHCWRF